MKAFAACVVRVGGDVSNPGFTVNDEKVFESIVRLCFAQLGKSLHALVGPMASTEDFNKEENAQKVDTSGRRIKKYSQRWRKHNSVVKYYLHALAQARPCTVHFDWYGFLEYCSFRQEPL